MSQLLPFVYVDVCRCTIGLNVALMVLFLSLSVTFFLLAAGQTNTKCMKASHLCLRVLSVLSCCVVDHDLMG